MSANAVGPRPFEAILKDLKSKRAAVDKIEDEELRLLRRKKLDRYAEKQQAKKEAEDSIWNKARDLVVSLRDKQAAKLFRDPVDHVALNIPDYPSIITTPMDLGTVKKKIEERRYAHPGEVAEDVRLIWSNSRVYNGPLHVLTKQADKLSEIFELIWARSKLEDLWLEVQPL
jgi:hypothetical protein